MPDELAQLRELEELTEAILNRIRRFIAYYETARHARNRHLRALAILPPGVFAAIETVRHNPRYAALASGIGSAAAAAGLTAAAMTLAAPPCDAQATPPPAGPAAPASPRPTPSPTPAPSPPDATITLRPPVRPPSVTAARTTTRHTAPGTPSERSTAPPAPTGTQTHSAPPPTTPPECWPIDLRNPVILRICVRHLTR